MTESSPPDPLPSTPPPHAFAQGVGTVFQFVGVTLFIISMFICCSSSLLSKDTATHTSLTTIGWHFGSDPMNAPSYSAQRAITIALPMSICYGMALAAVGLGLQSLSRLSPAMAVALNAFAVLFWSVDFVFFISLWWFGLSMICTLMAIIAGGLLSLSVGAWKDTRDIRSTKEIGHAV